MNCGNNNINDYIYTDHNNPVICGNHDVVDHNDIVANVGYDHNDGGDTDGDCFGNWNDNIDNHVVNHANNVTYLASVIF